MEDPQQTNSDLEINKENDIVGSPKPQKEEVVYDGNVRLKCKTCKQTVVCDKFYFGGYYFLAPHPTDDKYSFICVNCSPNKKPAISHHQKSWVLTGACALMSLELMVGWKLYECSEVESFIDSHFDKIAPGRVRDLNNKQNWRHVFRGQVTKSDDICREYIGDNLFYSLFRNGCKPTQQAEYIIDKILTERETNGEKEYKVKWVGFAKRYATWEKESHINTIDHFGEMLKDYITNKQNQAIEEEEEEDEEKEEIQKKAKKEKKENKQKKEKRSEISSDDEEDEDFEMESEEENEPESENEKEKEIGKQKEKKERKYSSILNAETESESDGEFARRARNKRQRTSSSSISSSISSISSSSSSSSSNFTPTRSRTRLSQNFSPSLSPSFSLPPAPTARYLPPSPPTLRQIKKEKRDKKNQERENKVTSEDETEQNNNNNNKKMEKRKEKGKEKDNNTTIIALSKHQYYKIKCSSCKSSYTAKEVGEVVPSPNCVNWKFTCSNCSRSRSHCFSFDPNKLSQVASRALFNLHVRDPETEFFSTDQIMAFVLAHPDCFKFSTPVIRLRKSLMSNPAPCVARKFVGSGLYKYIYTTSSTTTSISNANLLNSSNSNSSKSPSTKSQTTKSPQTTKSSSSKSSSSSSSSSSKSSNSLDTNLSNKNDPDVFIMWLGTDDIIGFVRCDLSKPLSSLRELLKTNGILKDKFLFVYKKAPVRLPQEQSIFVRECTFPYDDGFQIYVKQE